MNRLADGFRGDPEPSRQEEIDLFGLFRTLWRGKWFIGFATAVAAVAGGYYAFVVAVPKYPATVVVVMDQRQESPFGRPDALFGFGATFLKLRTEEVVLRSRELAGELVDNLDLTQDPEFNPRLRDDAGSLLGDLVARLLPRDETEAPPTAEEIRYGVIDAVIDSVSASNVPESLAYEITVTTEDPQKSVRIANTLADIYIENQLEVAFQSSERAIRFLSDRVAQLRQSLETAEAEANALRDDTALVSEEELAAQSNRLKNLRARLERLRETLGERRVLFERVGQLIAAGDFQSIAEIAGAPRLTRAIEAERAGEGSAAAVERAGQAVQARLQGDLERLRAQIASLETAEAELSGEFEAQSRDLIALQQREREIESIRILYETLLGRLNETEARRGFEQSDSRVLSRAVPRPASSPRKGLILMISAFLGATLGSGVVLVRELVHRGFRTPDELDAATDRVVMGMIPVVPVRRRRNVLTHIREKPVSVVTESLRNLRTSVLHANLHDPPKVIMVTSAVMGEGKTTVSLGLAHTLAAMSGRILVIEGDIRRRSFHRYFGRRQRATILDLLEDPALMDTPHLREENLGADLVLGARTRISATDLFASERFRGLLQMARERYDHILIDTPPVLVVPDARVIGQYADAILYVVKWDDTTKTQVAQGLQMFSTVGLNVSGLVLSQVSPSKMRSYGYGGQYGYGAYTSRYYQS